MSLQQKESKLAINLFFLNIRIRKLARKSVEPIDYQSSKEALGENKAIRETK